jgi:hypothetical protein
VRLVLGAEAPRSLALSVDDGRPRPAIALDEASRLLRRARDRDPEVRELGVILLKLCVGDRLALARQSPRCPDVHEHRLSSEVRE